MNKTVENLLNKLIDWSTTKGIKLIIGIAIIYIGWKIIKKIIKTMNNFLERKNVDVTLRSFLDAFVDIVLKIILIIAVMGYVEIETAGLAALIASAGLAVGLALQGSLSNFAGGVIILLIRPFNVGDYIDAVGYSGVVDKIRIFYTHLVTPDNKEILIPNGTLANGSVTNYSSKELRRVDLTFGVGYEDNILNVKRVLATIVEAHQLILKDPEPFISISEHGGSSLNFVVRVWVKNENYWKVHFDLLESVKSRFDEENISIPYPQMDVHIKKH